jgi:nucleoside 2-deoxyribosyltransferase
MVICRTCGKFVFENSAELFFMGLKQAPNANVSYRISFHLRTISERAWGKRDNSFFPQYSGRDFSEMTEHRDLPLSEKLVLLLRHLGNLSEYPGQIVRFSPFSDYSVLDAKNPAEADYHIRTLADQKLVLLESTSGAIEQQLQLRFGNEQQSYSPKITSNGWSELAKTEQSGWQSDNAFIAMWFDPSRHPFHEAMERAVTKAGYVPIRIDQVQHVNRIDDEIIAQIRRSKFVIADFSGQRGGVYFEAGFMLGLGRQVLWVCSKPELHDVHFDTRQYNFIDYTDAGDLERRLQMRIEAIFGKGPHRTSAEVIL